MDTSRILKLKPKPEPNVTTMTIEILKSPQGYSWVETDKDNIVRATSVNGQFFQFQDRAWEDYMFYRGLVADPRREVKYNVVYHNGEALKRADEIKLYNLKHRHDNKHYHRFNLRPTKRK